MQPTCSIQGSLASLCAILFTQLIVIITIILCSPTGLIFASALLLFNFSENCNNYLYYNESGIYNMRYTCKYLNLLDGISCSTYVYTFRCHGYVNLFVVHYC